MLLEKRIPLEENGNTASGIPDSRQGGGLTRYQKLSSIIARAPRRGPR